MIGERPANSAVIGGRPAKRAEVKSRAEDAGGPSCFAAAAAPGPAPVSPRPRSPVRLPRITGSSASSRPGQAAGRPGICRGREVLPAEAEELKGP